MKFNYVKMIIERFGHHRAQLEAPLILEIHNFQIVLVTVWQFVSFIFTTCLQLSHIPKDTKIITFGLIHLLMKIIGYAPGPLIAGVLIGGFQIRNTHCSHGWSAFLGHALLRPFLRK